MGIDIFDKWLISLDHVTYVSWFHQIAGYLNFLIRAAADLEIQMNSVERIKHYTHVENEDYGGEIKPEI